MKFIKNTGLATSTILILFLIRIASAFVHDWLSDHYYREFDSLFFHKDGVAEYHLLFNNPKEYFLNIFQSGHTGYSHLLDVNDSYWNDLRSNIIIKMLSI